VTLEEINSLIRDGYEVQVTDSRTGQDITAKVLAQIILELDSPKLGVFPVPLLHRLIRANEQLVSDFVEKYFNQALAAFLDSQKTFEQSVRQAMGLQSPMLGMPDWTKLMWGPFSPSLWPGGQRGGGAASSGAGVRGPEAASGAAEGAVAETHGRESGNSSNSNSSRNGAGEMREQVEELRQQLADLQQQLGETGKKRRRRGGSSGGH
jgi:polyhydroxyalkanoate synthesis repressor PhaR